MGDEVGGGGYMETLINLEENFMCFPSLSTLCALSVTSLEACLESFSELTPPI